MTSLIISHEDGVITRPGAALSDRTMTTYNYATKQSVEHDWSKKDRPMSRIDSALRQRLGSSWELYSDHVFPELTPISRQGRSGSCVANAICDMMETLDGFDGKDEVEQLSRRFLYWVARYLTGNTDADDGTFLRSAMHQLRKIGVVEERHFEFNDDPQYLISGGKYASPELDLYTMASNNRLTGFYKPDAATSIDNYLRSLEIAIRSNHPIAFGAPINNRFMQARGMEVFGPPDDIDIAGWHAMLLVGVTFDGSKRYWLTRNSWGTTWGDKGYAKVTDEYVLQFRDLWVGTKMHELI